MTERVATQMPYKEAWNSLEGILVEILHQDYTNARFELLYRTVYYIALEKKGPELFKAVENLIITHHQGEVSQDIIKSINSPNFLQVVATAWENYQTYMDMFVNILSYMNKEYQRRYGLTSIAILGMRSLRKDIIENKLINDHLRQAVFDLIDKERNGEVVEHGIIRDTFKMLMKIDGGSRTLYETTFERPFLKWCRDTFCLEVEKLLKENCSLMFIEKVEHRIHEESQRAKSYLDEITEEKLATILEKEFILNPMKSLVEMENSGLVDMFKHNQVSDIAKMFSFLSRVAGGTQTMAVCLAKHLQETGQVGLLEYKGNNKYEISTTYIRNILRLQDKMDLVLANVIVLSKMVVQNFLNMNANAPEYLSLYMDNILREDPKKKSDRQKEIDLDEALELFKGLQEKDIFQRYYEQHLAKRLLFQKSVNHEFEYAMIMKLMNECGSQFSSKSKGMFKDIMVSNTLNEDYQYYIDTLNLPTDIAFHVRVLTVVFWPIQTSLTCKLPDCAAQALNMFRDFYLFQHKGRRLMLNPGLGNADMFADFTPMQQEQKPHASASPSNVTTPTLAVADGSTRKYILNVSTFQMCVLMLFNDCVKMSYQDIKTLTEIEDKELEACLQSLAMGKPSQRVLTKTPKTKEIANTDIFSVNEDFESRLYRVKIQRITVRTEEKTESAQLKKNVDGDRRYVIEAAIMRVMKANKTMQHNDLMSEVISQLKNQFTPLPANIKKQIEGLIEKEYLARDEEDVKKYVYLV